MQIVCSVETPIDRILLIHSWWGLTPSFHDYADRLARHGFAVGLSDLFNGRTATSMDEARRLRRMPRRQPMYKSLIADIGELLAYGDGGADTVNLIGFSMGGHWAVWLSQRAELPVRSTVLYYASRAGDYSQSKASFLAHFAEDDPWVSTSARRNMERALSKANRPYRAFDYPGTGHWFAESDRKQNYDPEAAKIALQRTIAHVTPD